METIEISERVEVAGTPEVLVVGAGPAGVCAALAAAREGREVMLVEQTNALGGIATSGLHGHLCLFSTWGNTARVVGGIPHEICERTVAAGFGTYDGAQLDFETEGMKLVLEDMAAEAGIDFLYHTQFSSVTLRDGAIDAVIVQNKNGRQAFRPRFVIDCTGDADVAARSGVPFEKGREADGATQPMTLMFQLGGVDHDRVREFRYKTYPEKYGAGDTFNLTEVFAEAQRNGDMEPFQSRIMGWWWTPTRPDQLGINFTHIFGRDCTRAEDITVATVEGRRQAYATAEVYRKYIPGMENCWVSHCAALIGTRESRRIRGKYRITAEDVMGQKSFPDSIGYGSFFIDVHNCTGIGMDAETWRPEVGFKYQIPFRSLVPEGIDNLLVAGRCISCDHRALGSLRVMPQCMLMGQAAGTAAAMGVNARQAMAEFDTAGLQRRLRDNGAIVVDEDIVPNR
jgi:hypothetical protein